VVKYLSIQSRKKFLSLKLINQLVFFYKNFLFDIFKIKRVNFPKKFKKGGLYEKKRIFKDYRA
jgi:hypothetical protein